jgi:DNA-binding NarL/FixJ family response regulator
MSDDEKTVLIVSADDLLWTAVHVAVQTVAEVTVVDDVTDVDIALERARELKPDVLVTGLQVNGTRMLPVLGQIRASCPETRLIVIGEQFAAEDVRGLAALDVTACLVWQDLSFSALQRCMSAAVGGDFTILSRPVADLLMHPDACGRANTSPAVVLTERERVVLDGLAAGMTQEEVARISKIPLRTVKRTTAALSAKLAAPTPFVLGAKARDLRLLTSP